MSKDKKSRFKEGTKERFAQIGGQGCLAKHGKPFYRKIARKSVLARRKKR